MVPNTGRVGHGGERTPGLGQAAAEGRVVPALPGASTGFTTGGFTTGSNGQRTEQRDDQPTHDFQGQDGQQRRQVHAADRRQQAAHRA